MEILRWTGRGLASKGRAGRSEFLARCILQKIPIIDYMTNSENKWLLEQPEKKFERAF